MSGICKLSWSWKRQYFMDMRTLCMNKTHNYLIIVLKASDKILFPQLWKKQLVYGRKQSALFQVSHFNVLLFSGPLRGLCSMNHYFSSGTLLTFTTFSSFIQIICFLFPPFLGHFLKKELMKIRGLLEKYHIFFAERRRISMKRVCMRRPWTFILMSEFFPRL